MKSYSISTLVLVVLCCKSSAAPDNGFRRQLEDSNGFRTSGKRLQQNGFRTTHDDGGGFRIRNLEESTLPGGGGFRNTTFGGSTLSDGGRRTSGFGQPSNDNNEYNNPEERQRGSGLTEHGREQNQSEGDCSTSPTVVAGRSSLCSEKLILDDSFDGNKIKDDLWIVQQFIPEMGPDYEFVSYRKNISKVQGHQLVIKPKFMNNLSFVKGEMDLRNGCTSQNQRECYKRFDWIFLPPVKSGRIVSKLRFTYGTVQIKAKLPAGDWIYPQIYLEQVSNPNKKILIAYARGNEYLENEYDEDIGGRVLYAGPIIANSREPSRSEYLKSIISGVPYTNQEHKYELRWNPADGLVFTLDDVPFGSVKNDVLDKLGFARNELFQLVIGVGVGGINDFPDECVSNDYIKPWKNRSRQQIRDFFRSSNSWIRTWANGNCVLKVSFVKVFAW